MISTTARLCSVNRLQMVTSRLSLGSKCKVSLGGRNFFPDNRKLCLAESSETANVNSPHMMSPFELAFLLPEIIPDFALAL